MRIPIPEEMYDIRVTFLPVEAGKTYPYIGDEEYPNPAGVGTIDYKGMRYTVFTVYSVRKTGESYKLGGMIHKYLYPTGITRIEYRLEKG